MDRGIHATEGSSLRTVAIGGAGDVLEPTQSRCRKAQRVAAKQAQKTQRRRDWWLRMALTFRPGMPRRNRASSLCSRPCRRCPQRTTHTRTTRGMQSDSDQSTSECQSVCHPDGLGRRPSYSPLKRIRGAGRGDGLARARVCKHHSHAMGMQRDRIAVSATSKERSRVHIWALLEPRGQ